MLTDKKRDLASWRRSTWAARLAIVLAPALLLGACATVEMPDLSRLKIQGFGKEAPPEEVVAEAPAETLPIQDEVAVDRLQLAVDLLEHGQAAHAQGELKAFLEMEPESKPARYLLQQIETPVPLLFPPQSFEVKLGKQQTLSALAQIYLGDPLGFYGLARYNGISVPSKVAEGQTIHIPRTPQALAALKARTEQARARPAPRPAPRATQPTRAPAPASAPPSAAVAAATPAPVPAPVQTPEAAASALSASVSATAEAYYRSGVSAFQRQDLDGAIAAWDRTLALDPAHKGAQLSRTQAIDLKKNLEVVRSRTVADPVVAQRDGLATR